MEKITKSPRNYGIDLLRIVSMFMVVMIHIINNGAMPQNGEPGYYPVMILGTMVVCAVNCYALVSGYVGYGRKVKYTNLAVLWLRVLWYSVLITLIFKFLISGYDIGTVQLLKSFIPVYSRKYWFFTAYFMLFLFTPLLNAAIEKLNRNQLRFLICTVLFFTSVMHLVTRVIEVGEPFGLKDGYSVLWLIVLYTVGAYIKKYDSLSTVKPYIALVFYFLFIVAYFAYYLAIEKIVVPLINRPIYVGLLSSYTPIFTVGTALSLLVFFKNLKIKSGFAKIIGLVSPLVFSVYLIHTDQNIFRYILKFSSSLYQMPIWKEIPCIFGLALAIFVACIIIDIPREYLFKKLKLKEKIYKIEEKIKLKLYLKNGEKNGN